MKLKKYSKYKKSGIDWIGEIPEDWSMDRVKHLADFTKYYPIGDGDHGSIKPDMYQDEGIPYVRVQNLSWDGTMKLDDIVYISNDVNLANKKSILKEGDLLIAKTGATVGKLGLLNEKIKIANTTSSVGKITFNKKNHYPNFWKYSFQGKVLQDQILITAYQKSAQPGFNIDDLVEFNVITPPLQTQQKISSFLDSKTLQIQKLIEKDKKLIELLKEKRVSLINQAVTKGIKKDVKMKESGVEWVGEIPENWSVRKLKYILSNKKNSIKTGPFGTQLKIDEMEGNDVKIYNQKNVILGDEDLGENYVSIEKYKELISFRTGKGDLLITTRGTIGKCLILSENAENGILHPCLIKIKTKENYSIEYLKWIIQETRLFKDQIILKSNATTIEVIYQDTLKEIYVTFPTFQEQQEIVDFLDKETVKIDNHIKKVERRIELYEEYKKSLIYNVVTGKVEV